MFRLYKIQEMSKVIQHFAIANGRHNQVYCLIDMNWRLTVLLLDSWSIRSNRFPVRRLNPIVESSNLYQKTNLILVLVKRWITVSSSWNSYKRNSDIKTIKSYRLNVKRPKFIDTSFRRCPYIGKSPAMWSVPSNSALYAELGAMTESGFQRKVNGSTFAKR